MDGIEAQAVRQRSACQRCRIALLPIGVWQRPASVGKARISISACRVRGRAASTADSGGRRGTART